MQLPLAVFNRPRNPTTTAANNEPPPPYLLADPAPYLALPPEERERRKRLAYEKAWRPREAGCILVNIILLASLCLDRRAGREDREEESSPWVWTLLYAMVFTGFSTMLIFLLRIALVKRLDNGLSTTASLSLDGLLLVAWTYIFVATMVAFSSLDGSSERTTWAVCGIACVVLHFLYAVKVVTRVPCMFEKRFGPMLLESQVTRDGV